jgi:hypothetical protein
MVVRHAKNHNLPSYKEGDMVRLLLPERFCKLSRKAFVICQAKSGPHRYSLQLVCEFGIIDCRYPSSKLQPLSPMLWSHYAFPTSYQKVSISEVADRLRQAPKPQKCNCRTTCGTRCSCICRDVPCSHDCHKGEDILCGNHFAAAGHSINSAAQPASSSATQ